MTNPLVEPNGFVSSVDIGMHEISPHRENGSSPFTPDAVWFCCTVPAAQGGETVVLEWRSSVGKTE